jgi:hypothetical protein
MIVHSKVIHNTAYSIVSQIFTTYDNMALKMRQTFVTRPDDEGIIKSRSLPGLWIPVKALRKRNFWTVMASIE